MNYVLNKKLFWIPIIITILLISVIVFMEGFSVFQETKTITCDNDLPCINPINGEGKQIQYLQPGETIIINQHENKLIDFTNNTTWALIFLAFIFNHYIYNREYNFKMFKEDIKSFKTMFKKIELP